MKFALIFASLIVIVHSICLGSKWNEGCQPVFGYTEYSGKPGLSDWYAGEVEQVRRDYEKGRVWECKENCNRVILPDLVPIQVYTPPPPTVVTFSTPSPSSHMLTISSPIFGSVFVNKIGLN